MRLTQNTYAPIKQLMFGLLFVLPLQRCLSKTVNQPSYIGIVNAMPSEARPIRRSLNHKKTVIKNGITYVIGTFAHKHIVSVVTGIGKVNAAAITTALVLQFHPRAIFLSGIAGSLKKNLTNGDIVVANSVYEVEHQTIYGKPSPDDINPNTNKPNPSIVFSNKRLLSLAKTIQWPNQKPTVVFARIATTDIYPPIKYSIQQAIQSGASAIDMESFSVLAVCQLFHTPGLIVRAISDNSKAPLQQSYQRNHYRIKHTGKTIAENNAAQLVLLLIKKLS